MIKRSAILAISVLFAGLGFAQSGSQASQTPAVTTLSMMQDGPAIDVPTGQALTEGEIIILLQAKVPVESIQKFVSVRGVSFASSKEVSKRILSAGGNVALIGTISLNQRDDGAIDPNAKKKK